MNVIDIVPHRGVGAFHSIFQDKLFAVFSQEILNFWKELESDKSVPRDFYGRVAGQELRLDIPLKQQAFSDRTSFHTKFMQQQTKNEKSLGDADKEAYRLESQMGHLRSDDVHFQQHGSMSKALNLGLTGRNPFSAALPVYAAGYNKPTTAAGAGREDPGSPGSAFLLADDGPKKPEAVAIDPELARAEAYTLCSSQVNKAKTKLQDVLKESLVGLARRDVSSDEQDHSSILTSRCAGAFVLLGCKPTPAIDDGADDTKPGVSVPMLKDQATVQEKKEFKKDCAKWMDDMKKTLALQPAGDMETATIADWLAGLGGVSPVTQPDMLKDLATVMQEVENIKKQTTEDGVKLASSRVAEYMRSWEEYVVNMRRTMSALVGKINKRKADADRMAQSKQKKQKTEDQEKSRAAVDLATKNLVKAAEVPAFMQMNATTCGFEIVAERPKLLSARMYVSLCSLCMLKIRRLPRISSQ